MLTRPTAAACHPIPVRRVTGSLHASFRPSLTGSALALRLPFTSIRLGRGLSPPDSRTCSAHMKKRPIPGGIGRSVYNGVPLPPRPEDNAAHIREAGVLTPGPGRRPGLPARALPGSDLILAARSQLQRRVRNGLSPFSPAPASGLSFPVIYFISPVTMCFNGIESRASVSTRPVCGSVRSGVAEFVPFTSG